MVSTTLIVSGLSDLGGNLGGFAQPGNHCIALVPNSNTIWFVYNTLVGSAEKLRVVYSTDSGANWTQDVEFSFTTSQIVTQTLAVDSSGGIHLVWGDSSAGTVGEIRYSRRISAGNWTTVVAINDITKAQVTGSTQRSMAVAVDSFQKVHVVGWDQKPGFGSIRPYYITNESGSFVTMLIDTSSADGDTSITYRQNCSLMFDADNTLHCLRQGFRSGVAHVSYHTKAHGQPWADWGDTSTYENIAEYNSAFAQATSDLAIDSNKKAHVVIGDVDAPNSTMKYYNRVSGSWAEIATLESISGTTEMGRPSIAVDRDGFAHCAYPFANPTNEDIRVKTINTSTGVVTLTTDVTTGGTADHSTQQDGPFLANHCAPFQGFYWGILGSGFCGFYLENTSGSDRKIYFFKSDDFAFPTLEDLVTEGPPSCPAEPDRASKALAGEGTASLTYPQTPDMVFEERERFQTRKVESDHGYETTHSRFPASRRMWTATHFSISKTQRDTIMAFIEARLGAEEAFNFTLVETGGTVKVRFLPETIRAEKKAPDVYDVTFQLEELLT